ncbi:MAG TPA: hypothetical protein VFB21_19880, partial [Chthonomonadaceae bacterium]|nr:hypothetical protein [Chthonomonadaceae bacterium]
ATRLILIGAKSELDIARSLLEQTDVPQPSVRIEALLVELTETGLKNLGITWSLTNENTPTIFPFTIPGSFTIPNASVPVPGHTGLDFGKILRSSASFSVALQALVNQSQARILARPNISVLDNEDASIFIGDLLRFPGATIVVPNAGSNIQNFETIPIGIALLVRPRIHPDGQVTLKVHPVVSTLTTINQNGPQIASREADTTVRLHEGEELVIGGLDRSEIRSTLFKVPILGDIPLIGELFRSRRRETTKNEIVVVIRAYPLLTDPAPPHDFRRSKE